jgi:hypothetical protein
VESRDPEFGARIPPRVFRNTNKKASDLSLRRIEGSGALCYIFKNNAEGVGLWNSREDTNFVF